MEITPGLTYTAETTVNHNNIASAVGSGLVDVFATPMMIALIELAASECVKPCLNEGQATVGTKISVSHTAATPIGMKVTATASVTEIDRHRIEFEVSARDETGEIGCGTHTRFIIDIAAFIEKAAGR